ncbi:hypothetical protein Godav_012121 [Gossypium davidsonii]|uniref:Uncharacterized protein n=2 Tax=Gossypium TaxID=3633 RepID=A0A7J8RCV0_GOSDV|nr:hypothetical protein [Gossypium davidsonii]MBA0646553.1 hypothetical protein [Gossypium klotzschianum]
MPGIGTLVDLLLFYTLERVLFNRMVISMGKNSQQVKSAMTLWLMLEEIGYHELIRIIHSYDDDTIDAFFEEALQCLQFIQPNVSSPSDESYDTPVFLGLFDEPMNYRFFYYNREFMYKRYVHIMDTVCDKIFGENAAIEVDESGLKPAARPLGEGSTTSQVIGESNSNPSLELKQYIESTKVSNLNPGANEFRPGQTPEDTRTMFITFSKGHPLSGEEIFHFFTSNWGEVVQDVVIEHTSHPGQEPQFGRIVFTTSLVIPMVLNGQSKAKFLVNRKHLWARIYVPRYRGRRKLASKKV